MFKKIILLTVLSILFFIVKVNAQDPSPMNSIFDKINETYTSLYIDDIKKSNALRIVIDSLINVDINEIDNFRSITKSKINEIIFPNDSDLGKYLYNKIESDTIRLSECWYIYKIKKNYRSTKSNHFRFYYEDDSQVPNEELIDFWEEQFLRLTETFHVELTSNLNFIIDKNDKWGRCYAPWELKHGIIQNKVGINPHELVHIMLFKYSDVPFFHEPLAFIYGTDLGEIEISNERFLRYKNSLNSDTYISSLELLHFPQIIGLDENKWASAFCFVYTLQNKYGFDKLLDLMKQNLWDSTVEEFTNSFNMIYGISLKEFEMGMRKSFN